jgi:FkbM family methyltransferase
VNRALSLNRPSSWLRSLSYLASRWLLRRPFLIAQLPNLGLSFKVKTEDVLGRHLYKYHAHEPHIGSFLTHHLRFEPGDIVFDIGANIGWYSLLLGRMIPPGVNIYSFEPDPLNFELLEHNLRLNHATQVTAIQKALATEDGTQQLHRHDSNNLGRHSLLNLQDGESVAVKTTSLDNFWDSRELGSRTPRFIKIDIEGYELLALRGAEKILQRCPELLCEYSPNFMRQGGLNPADLIMLLTGHGFTPHFIDNGALRVAQPDTLVELDEVTDLFWRKPAAG